jgi:hypothetical protein
MATIREILRGLVAFVTGLWWVLEDGARVLYACRAAALVVAIGALLIAETDQARDMVLIAAREASTWAQVGLAACVLAWAVASWFWSRLTLDVTFASPPPPVNSAWREFVHAAWVDNIPRLIGAAAIWSLAVAFFRSARALRLAGSDAASFYEQRGWICVAAGFVLYAVFVARRYILRWLGRPVLSWLGIYATFVKGRPVLKWLSWPVLSWFHGRNPGKPTVSMTRTRARYSRVHHVLSKTGLGLLLLSLITTPFFTYRFLVDPVSAAAFFGDSVRAILFGLAILVSLLGALVLFGEQHRLPLFSGVLLAAVIVPVAFSDTHDVRLCRDQQRCADLVAEAGKVDRRMSLRDTFGAWWAENSAEELTKRVSTYGGPEDMVVPPMIVVAAAGGASRAAYWTTQVLGELAEREPNFVRRLFMISGVSGGSLGATVFRSLIEEDRLTNGGGDSQLLPDAARRGGEFMAHDFLAPAMATGLYVDLPLAPFSFSRNIVTLDRAIALEKSWEHAWNDRRPRADAKDGFNWSDGFVWTFGSSQRPWPILALNGTSVEKGKRVIASNVRFHEADVGLTMAQPENRYDALSMLQSDVPISTAVTMSARFPVISPSGGLRDRHGNAVGRVVDGGLFENFGALTADEVVRYVAHRLPEARRLEKPVVPIVILISSDPTLDPLMSYETLYGSNTPLIATTQSKPDCDSLDGTTVAAAVPAAGHKLDECPYRPRETAQSLLDPALSLYTGRTARGESLAGSLLGRLKDLNRAIYDDLNEKIDDSLVAVGLPKQSRPTSIYRRMGGIEDAGFFHFRQCRIDRRKSPTMSWHNSERGRETMRIMTGLGGEHDPRGAEKGDRDTSAADLDPCGNAAEFHRLCVKLARVADGLDDDQAQAQCAGRWPSPARRPADQIVDAPSNVDRSAVTPVEGNRRVTPP